MENRILLISTYDELTAMSRKVAAELGTNLDIYEGGIMKNGHLYAKQNQDKYDVIISSGGTAEAIRQIVQKPVVAVEISTVDILSALYEARKFGNKIGMVVYKNEELMQLYNLKDYMDVDFEMFPYETKEELSSKVNDAMAYGKITLVGMGGCITETAKSKSLDYIIIRCREKHVRDALTSALNICRLSRDDKEQAKRYQAILDNSGEGIISFDRNYRITSINASAEKMLDVRCSDVINQNIHDIKNDNFKILFGDGTKVLGQLMKLNNKQMLVNRIPIIIDDDMMSIVVNFQETVSIQKIEHKLRTELYRKGLIAKYTFSDIVGDSEEIKQTIEKAKKIGRTNSTVLITAETGTGKELFAQSMHNVSDRRDGPFVAINCAALPENLLESELFGYEEGAFTGAKKGGKIGLFELAHKGTIFLDEISEIPIGLQGRLLRALQEREILRVGGDYVINVDIRVIAASNINLYEKVQEGKFREDLFFRINVLDLYIPPLRERNKDILLILDSFFRQIDSNIHVKNLKKDAVEWLVRHSWPGNVRELENFAQKMNILLGDKEEIDEQNLTDITDKKMAKYSGKKERPSLGDNAIQIEIGNLKDMENKIILEAAKSFKGDKSMLADKLGISRTTLWKKLKDMGIE